jgi:hypothetical protein
MTKAAKKPPRNGRAPQEPLGKRPLLSREEWLARREARREQQRKDSVERAAQMHRARLAHTTEAKQPEAKLKSACYVGCSG